MKKVKVVVPSSIGNVGPGFDCLGVALKLYNKFECWYDLSLQRKHGKPCIQVVGSSVDRDVVEEITKNNVVLSTIEKVCKKYNIKPNISKLIMEVNIPLARGLGSSGTAYIAGVAIGDAICGNNMSGEEVVNFAVSLEGHPDNIVASYYGGLCASTLVENKVKHIKVEVPNELVVLLFIPDIKISTEVARKILPASIPRGDCVKNLGNLSLLLLSILSKKYELIKLGIQDYLHQPYRRKIMPWMYEVFSIFERHSKVLGVALSGAGPTIFGIYRRSEVTEDIAFKLLGYIRKRIGIDGECKIIDFDNRGTRVIL
jgi:homoserine kinase